jgi:hypothetical protein
MKKFIVFALFAVASISFNAQAIQNKTFWGITTGVAGTATAISATPILGTLGFIGFWPLASGEGYIETIKRSCELIIKSERARNVLSISAISAIVCAIATKVCYDQYQKAAKDKKA